MAVADEMAWVAKYVEDFLDIEDGEGLWLDSSQLFQDVPAPPTLRPNAIRVITGFPTPWFEEEEDLGMGF